MKLIIEVEYGTEACGDCRFITATDIWECDLFGEYLGERTREDILPPRCPACLAAEEKLNAIERRYAELVEDVSRRTDQAAGEKGAK